MIFQLRTYHLAPDKVEAFQQRFKDHASRFMRECGFDIRGAWRGEYEGRQEFHYLMAWPDEQTMNKGWSALINHPQWQAVKRRTNAEGDLVLAKQDRLLTQSPIYSD